MFLSRSCSSESLYYEIQKEIQEELHSYLSDDDLESDQVTEIVADSTDLNLAIKNQGIHSCQNISILYSRDYRAKIISERMKEIQLGFGKNARLERSGPAICL